MIAKNNSPPLIGGVSEVLLMLLVLCKNWIIVLIKAFYQRDK